MCRWTEERGCSEWEAVVLTFRFYWMPGIDKYLMYIHLQNPCCGWNIPVDRLGNGSSKKLSDLFQGQLGFKPWADSEVQALDIVLYWTTHGVQGSRPPHLMICFAKIHPLFGYLCVNFCFLAIFAAFWRLKKPNSSKGSFSSFCLLICRFYE